MLTYADYPFHGECKIVYSEFLEEENIRLGPVGNSDNWKLQVFTLDPGQKNFMFAILNFLGVENGAVFRTYYYISFLNHKDESKSKVYMEKFECKRRISPRGVMLKESEVMEENSGWLKDGELTVQFGIHVEAFKETIWTFNFHEPTFQTQKTGHSICFEKKKEKSEWRFCHRQLLIHHSSPIAKDLNKNGWFVEFVDCFKFDSLEKCLQIVHGARITIGLSDLLKVLIIADYYKLYNVMRYCEMEFIQRRGFIRNHIQFATHFKLSRYLACALRDVESPEAIKEDFRHVNIDSMNGEMMKQCVMYLLDFY